MKKRRKPKKRGPKETKPAGGPTENKYLARFGIPPGCLKFIDKATVDISDLVAFFRARQGKHSV